jgi:DNA-binding IclR family transcriptional regulator
MNGLDVLEAVMAAEEPMGSRELGRQLGLDRSTANRLLMTLAHLGMLSRTEDGRYRPGEGIHALAAMSLRSSGLLRAALPIARGWHTRGCAWTMGVLWRGHLCHLISVRPDQPFDDGIGGRPVSHPLDSAAGLVLLAHADPAMLARLGPPSHPVPELGPALLERIRKTGQAVRRFEGGWVAVGVPVGTPPRAAIAVSSRDWRDDVVPAIAAELTAQAEIIQRTG